MTICVVAVILVLPTCWLFGHAFGYLDNAIMVRPSVKLGWIANGGTNMQNNEYDVTVIKVVDGDTVDVDIDLGFGVTLKDERVRIMGIDTPESRTSDRVEDLFGEAAKARLKELMKDGGKLITTEDKKGEDMKGKFGRILGDFKVEYNGEMKKCN